MNHNTKPQSGKPYPAPTQSPGVPRQKVSVGLILLGILGSIIVTVLVYLLFWAIFWSDTLSSWVMNDAFFLILYLGILLGPGIIVALVVLPLLRKK